jgi:hypothetical protein
MFDMTSRDSDASLNLFLPEGPSDAEPVRDFHGVSLADVMRRGTPVAWDEAVAVIEELCVVLSTSDRGRGAGLDAGDVMLSRDGRVALARRLDGPASPAEVARVLHAVLESTQVPVALRLLVTATLSGAYKSIAEFSAALAYYGKPGREALVSAVHARCIARPPEQPGTVARPAPRKVTLAARLPRPRVDWTRVLNRRTARAAGAAAALVAIGLSAWYVGRLAFSGAGQSDFTVDGVVSTVQDLGRELRDQPRIRLTPEVATARASTPAALPTPAGPAPASRAQAAYARPAAGGAPAAAAGVAAPVAVERANAAAARPEARVPATAAASAASAASTEGSPAAPAAPAAPPVAVPARPAASVFAEPVDVIAYSRADADVQPPVLLYPQQPPALIPNTPPDAMNSMELLVTEHGLVERVRIVAGPRRMPDMMLLSGAKMWRFRPAVKDGQPVRYRTTISWSGLP